MKVLPLALALAAIGLAAPSHASLVLQGPQDFQGTGLGSANTVLTIQSRANSSFESGSVGRAANSPADVISGDAMTGASQTQTRSLGELGLLAASDLRVVFNASEPGNSAAQSIVLSDLVLNIYAASGELLFSSGAFSPVSFADTYTGAGNSGFVFALDATQAAAAQASAFGVGFEGNRIGLSAAASNATGGFETFFVANAAQVPEPGSMSLLALGLFAVGLSRHRRLKR